MERMKEIGVTPDVDFFNLLMKKRQFRKDYTGAKVGATKQLFALNLSKPYLT